MKTVLLTAVAVIGFVSAVNVSLAKDGPDKYIMNAPVFDMTVQGHAMHLRGLEDTTGGHWVVLKRDEAEMLLGQKLDGVKFMKMDATGQ